MTLAKPAGKEVFKVTKLGSWGITFDISLDGETMDFESLSESTQEHIIELIKEGYYSGEIVEETDNDDEEEE